jgi:hypothetical protein
MLSCGICLDTLNAPVALICGHVFCEDCVVRIIHSVKPFRTSHACPTCRNTFSIVNMSPAFVPAHLRPYVSPSVRRLYLDQGNCSNSTVTPTGTLSSPNPDIVAQLEAQNAALRISCEKWRRQAEAHATARYQLLELAQASRSYSHHLEKENGELRRKLDALTNVRIHGDYRTGRPITSSSSPRLSSVPTSPGQLSTASSSSSSSSSPFLGSYQDDAASPSSSKPRTTWSHHSPHHDPSLPSSSPFTSTTHSLSPQLSRPQHNRSLSDTNTSTPTEASLGMAANHGRGSCFTPSSGPGPSPSSVSVGKRKRSNTAPEASTAFPERCSNTFSMLGASSSLGSTSHDSMSPRPLKRACHRYTS